MPISPVDFSVVWVVAVPRRIPRVAIPQAVAVIRLLMGRKVRLGHRDRQAIQARRVRRVILAGRDDPLPLPDIRPFSTAKPANGFFTRSRVPIASVVFIRYGTH